MNKPKTSAKSPERVVPGSVRSYPWAIAKVLGPKIEHEPISCTANRIEPDHRGIKHRYYPTLGFHNFDAA